MRHQNGKQEEGMRDRGEGGENPLTLSLSQAAVEGEVEATHSFTFPYSLKRRFKREGEKERGAGNKNISASFRAAGNEGSRVKQPRPARSCPIILPGQHSIRTSVFDDPFQNTLSVHLGRARARELFIHSLGLLC